MQAKRGEILWLRGLGPWQDDQKSAVVRSQLRGCPRTLYLFGWGQPTFTHGRYYLIVCVHIMEIQAAV